jgi:NAD(P)H-dependent flavin oxidoreductase YrpB (nitropropane dioxygenase family)
LVTTLVVVRAVVKALDGRLPVIASGGFVDGAGLAAALALGAGAANFGTRVIATPESGVHAAYKRAVLKAGISGTCTVGRGLGMIRMISNSFSERILALEASGAPLTVRKTERTGPSVAGGHSWAGGRSMSHADSLEQEPSPSPEVAVPSMYEVSTRRAPSLRFQPTLMLTTLHL